jgi:hypothetical protein
MRLPMICAVLVSALVRQTLVRHHASGSAVFRSRRASGMASAVHPSRPSAARRATKRQQRDARGFEPGKPSQPARLDPKRKGIGLFEKAAERLDLWSRADVPAA